MALTRDKVGRSRAGTSQPGEAARYEQDPYSWSLQQARLLREGRLDLIDVQNIADEIADVARREARALRSSIRLVLQHLLKWDRQPDRRSRSWVLTIRTQRRAIVSQLDDNPGLQSEVMKLLEQAYPDARDAALDETGLPESALPEICPYGWDDIMSRPIIWPEKP